METGAFYGIHVEDVAPFSEPGIKDRFDKAVAKCRAELDRAADEEARQHARTMFLRDPAVRKFMRVAGTLAPGILEQLKEGCYMGVALPLLADCIPEGAAIAEGVKQAVAKHNAAVDGGLCPLKARALLYADLRVKNT